MPTAEEIRAANRKRNAELGLVDKVRVGEKTTEDSTFLGQGTPEQSKDLSEKYGSGSFDGLTTLPGEKSGEEKARETRFREYVYDWRKDPGYQERIEGKGAKVSDIEQIEKNYLFFNPDIGAPRTDFGTEGNRRWGEYEKDVELPKYSPPKNATPVQQYQYEAQYAKSVAEAYKSQSDKIRRGVGAEQESSLGRELEKDIRDRSGKLKVTEQVNPEYTKLTAEQRLINQQRKERGEDYVKEVVSVDTGLSVGGKMTREQRQSAQDLTKAINMIESTNANVRAQGQQMLDALPQGVRDNYTNWKAAQNRPTGTTAGDISKEEASIRRSLNMSQDDELTFSEDGTPLINGKTESESALARAEKRSNINRNEDLRDLKQQYDLQSAATRSAYTVDGKLTKQGANQLAKEKREYNETVATTNRRYDENLEDYERQEKKRDEAVKARNKKVESPQAQNARIIAQERAEGAVKLQQEYEAKGIQKSFAAAANEWDALQKYKTAKTLTKGERFAQQMDDLDALVASPTFDENTLYEMGMSKFGNTKDPDCFPPSPGASD